MSMMTRWVAGRQAGLFHSCNLQLQLLCNFLPPCSDGGEYERRLKKNPRKNVLFKYASLPLPVFDHISYGNSILDAWIYTWPHLSCLFYKIQISLYQYFDFANLVKRRELGIPSKKVIRTGSPMII